MPQSSALESFNDATRKWFAECVGVPTPVQEEGWPAIDSGGHVLISAPTGTGKTLSAFLVFIDRLKRLGAEGKLEEKLYVIYISPLKALGNDIRENLRRPIEGIAGPAIRTAVRTGDTPQVERQRMTKRPPHILITTPESLYLLLTSPAGKRFLSTAEAVIVDELHALINSKRGAHLMLSLTRLDRVCGRRLQRIGLSATIEPLEIAAQYLAFPETARVVNPRMAKKTEIRVAGALPDMRALPEGTIWPELARMVHAASAEARTVIVFAEGRAQAEKLSFYVNLLGGKDYSRTHHGCVSKEQRLEAEKNLKNGKLKVLCATSSMELGIDVGEVDLVLQIGYPRTIASAMQRLGRAGHNPGRTSVMHLLPRTAAEGVNCGLTAALALEGGIEHSSPPLKCLDVLAQHLVSMATEKGYATSEALEIANQTFCFRDVSRAEIESLLAMLAGDFEHQLDKPVRPRVLYDRIHGVVRGDAYSRMLALSTGGTIPDRGYYAVRLNDGTKIGELDEEFVFEARVGNKFMLGAFAWRITEISRDTVSVAAASSVEGTGPPFWRGEQNGRTYQTGVAFGKKMQALGQAGKNVREALRNLRLDDNAAVNAERFLRDQIEATDILPDHQNIIVEHFKDQAGESQIMVHSLFGKRVNAGLAMLAQHAAAKETGMDVKHFSDDDGFLLFPYGGEKSLPEHILQRLDPDTARPVIAALLPAAPLFNMAFRYNAARALMMGMRNGRRQPLWVQRLRGAEALDNAVLHKHHPLIAETTRECLDDYLDIAAIQDILRKIKSGLITIRELHLKSPSPMSLPFRRQAEATLMYDYTPTTSNVAQSVSQNLDNDAMIRPSGESLNLVAQRERLPKNEDQLHALLMTEGDVMAGDIEVPVEWFESLAAHGRAEYIEPGLWISAEHAPDYSAALIDKNRDAIANIVRRCLRYRGPQDADSISERYVLDKAESLLVLAQLVESKHAVESSGLYYHADLYTRARHKTVQLRRRQIKTLSPEHYAHLLCRKLRVNAPPAEQIRRALNIFLDLPLPPHLWEHVIFPARVDHYQPALLDNVLSHGEVFWRFAAHERPLIAFHSYADINWEQHLATENLTPAETAILDFLRQRGASFSHSLPHDDATTSVLPTLIALAEKGLLHTDSFVPVRYWIDRDKLEHYALKQRVRSQALVLSAGRWDLARPLSEQPIETALERAFDRSIILCRETASPLNWTRALEKLRIWEYMGKVRRGYFIQGLSGAQFIRDTDYYAALSIMDEPGDNITWLHATDPAQIWGKAVAHLPGRAFTNTRGSVVALRAGRPVCLLENQGKVLRVFEPEHLGRALVDFITVYKQRRIFSTIKRISVKTYPPNAVPVLADAGFLRQMLDYEIRQS